MKKTIVLVVILIFNSICFSQDYSQEELSSRLRKSLRMKHTGQTLTVVGIVLEVVGIVLYVKGTMEEFDEIYDDDYDFDEDYDEYNSSSIVGSLFTIGGTACLGTGIPLWIVGNIKSNRYRNLLNNSDMTLSLVAKNRGIGLQLTF